MTVVDDLQRAYTVEHQYVHRFLEELARLETGDGSNEAYTLALELLRHAHTKANEQRQRLMTEVGV